MKRVLLLVALIFSLSLTHSQDLHYGFFAGANLNSMKIGTELYFNSDQENCDKPFMLGFREGLFVEYSPWSFLGFQCEFSFAEYGYRIKIQNETSNEIPVDNITFVETTISEGKGNTVVNDISLSLLAKFYLFKQHLSIDFGVQPNWTISSYRTENITTEKIITLDGNIMGQEMNEKSFTGSVPYNSRNLSIIGGSTYYINKNIFVSARYMFGLKDVFVKEVGYFESDDIIVKKQNQTSKHRVIQFAFGFRFK